MSQQAHPVNRVALKQLLQHCFDILVFADGLAVYQTGRGLADLYAEDCEWAQTTLRSAGCWPRGTFENATSEEETT